MPGAGGSQRLLRAIGRYQAMRLVLLGDAIGAAEAHRLGMISELVDDHEVLPRALAIADTIAALPPLAVGLLLDTMKLGEDASLSASLALEKRTFQLLFATADQKEGMNAFLGAPPSYQLETDDLVVGEVWQGRPITVTKQAIVAFAREFNPQPFHTDADAAKASPFGSLVASGWHLLALVMRCFVEARPYGGTPVIGRGVDDLRGRAPARPGDTLTMRREIVEVTRSHPDRGCVRSRVELANQASVELMRFDVLTRMPTRPHAGRRA